MDRFDLFRAWLRDKDTTRLAPDSLRTFRGLVFECFATTGMDPLRASKGAVGAYLDRIHGGAKRRLAHTALSHFFRFLVRRKLRADNPLAQLRRPRQGILTVKRGLTEEELIRLVVAAVGWGPGRRAWGGERLAREILALYFTGCPRASSRRSRSTAST